jgi:hypothetical protein
MQITSHLFEYTWNLWKSDVQTILQNLSMLSQRNDIDSILEKSNDLVLICDRWLLCLKIIRQLIYSGYASDSTTAQVIRFAVKPTHILLHYLHQLVWKTRAVITYCKLQEVWQVREVCPTVLTAIQSLLPYCKLFFTCNFDRSFSFLCSFDDSIISFCYPYLTWSLNLTDRNYYWTMRFSIQKTWRT